MKVSIAILLAGFAAVSMAQTPPIQPDTPGVKVPPRIDLPGVEAGKAPLAVEEAVAIALRSQPTIAIAQANVRASEARLRQAQSDLFPQFGASGSFSEQRSLRSGSSSNQQNRFTAGLSADQLLFDFGRTRDLVRQQSAVNRAQQRALERSRQDVVLGVKISFYNLLQARELLRVAEANLASRQRQLDQSQARLDTGLGAPGDVVRARTNLADAVFALENARIAESNARIILAEQMGIDPLTPISPAPSSEAPLADEDDVQRLVELALRTRPDILEAQERVSAARFAVSAAQKGNLPRITANAGLASRGANEPFSNQSATFGLNIAWSFGDGGLTAGRVQESRANEEVARQQLVQLGQRVVTDVAQAWVELGTAQQRVGTAEVQVANAQELVRIAEGRYAGGIGLFLDVVDAQNSVVAAERNLAQARLDVQRARANLSSAIGM